MGVWDLEAGIDVGVSDRMLAEGLGDILDVIDDPDDVVLHMGDDGGVNENEAAESFSTRGRMFFFVVLANLAFTLVLHGEQSLDTPSFERKLVHEYFAQDSSAG